MQESSGREVELLALLNAGTGKSTGRQVESGSAGKFLRFNPRLGLASPARSGSVGKWDPANSFPVLFS